MRCRRHSVASHLRTGGATATACCPGFSADISRENGLPDPGRVALADVYQLCTSRAANVDLQTKTCGRIPPPDAGGRGTSHVTKQTRDGHEFKLGVRAVKKALPEWNGATWTPRWEDAA